MRFLYEWESFRPIAQIDHIPNQTNLLLRYTDRGPIQKELLAIQNQFQHMKDFSFYTDGSLVELGNEMISMSLAFMQVDCRSPEIKFRATFELWPNSTRVEIAAILTVLLVVPRNAKLFIYTDSENTIKHMDKQTTICNARHLFKENNNLSWKIIREIININNLDL